MLKTFMFRLYPTRRQNTLLCATLDWCRWVYNETLATRKNAWEQEHQSLSLYATNKLLTGWKQAKPELARVHSQVLQNAQERVDLAFKAFFRRVKAGGEKPGYPRYKGHGRYDSFTFKQSGFSLQGNVVRLSKIGLVKVKRHRPIEGKIKTLSIRRDAVGKWYACFSCETEPHLLPASEKAVGVDVGLESFATFSNGEKIANPRFFRRDERELAKAQRKLSKAEKGTSERARRRMVVAHVYQRMVNRRKDFAHKLSRSMVNAYGLIALEKLNTQGMLQNHYLAKSIADAAWHQLMRCTLYKAEEAGRVCVLVDPNGTSQRCSRCGGVVKKSLAVRVHDCPICGLKMDRDENAAINILALGLQCLDVSPGSHAASAAVE
jgi:putative transposase